MPGRGEDGVTRSPAEELSGGSHVEYYNFSHFLLSPESGSPTLAGIILPSQQEIIKSSEESDLTKGDAHIDT